MASLDVARLSALVILLLVCAGFTIGLTFAPCYSSLCVERFFPYQARVHLAVYYSLLAGVLAYMVACCTIPALGKFTSLTLTSKPLQLIGKRLSIGGILLTAYLSALTFGSIGYWYPELHSYWYARAAPVDFTQKIYRLVWTGVTGHWLDILIGLVILPIGRNSLIGRTFKIPGSTLILIHKILGYTLCAGALVHGLIYYSYLAYYVDRATEEPVFQEFLPDNPTVTWKQSEEQGIYTWFVLPTGAITGIIIIPVMVVTALPVLRRISYNTFYFLHITLAALALILVSLHASTDFYCLLPGLLLWVYDWVWRLRHSLVYKAEISVQDAGNGWYRLVLPSTGASTELQVEKAESSHMEVSPLQTYYVNIKEISRIENHPFTAAVGGTAASGPTLLLRKCPERKKAKSRDKEWTWKLAALMDNTGLLKVNTTARIEGPYSPHTPELYTADHIIVLAAGTGVTGALSLARWWAIRNRSAPHGSLRIVWSVRDVDMAELQEVQYVQAYADEFANMEFIIHDSSTKGRINMHQEMGSALQAGSRTWVYISGPETFSADAEAACWERKTKLGHGQDSLAWYTASYAV
ncbi:hypothetical protein AMS68_007478 [Peltaster fructicola]|uniref:Ferric oxidoreductase domain-containing protein n=1 Tax=Peltaster fructicola TaxID=286661 RepID=A0A6H0Y4W5_9PEZI|nr:hypothetical protein AMS68_007478 [Peltaster fructicola]